MNHANKFSGSTLVFFLTGLLLVSSAPIFCRHFALPDMLKGFLTGTGLMLEMIAIIKMRKKRSGAC